MGKNVFATPLLDSTFKLVFGEKKHKQVTIDFLNDLLERTGRSNAINDISFMHQELAPRRFDDKKSILDISCTDVQGNHFIIEIQRKSEEFFDWRLFYYAASLLSRQLQETEPYSKLTPVIILGILNFKLYPDFDEPISHHMMCDIRTGKQSIPLVELHIVELGKFNKKVDELVTHIDKWLFFLKKAHEQAMIPEVYHDSPAICQAFDVLARWNWKPEQVMAYDREVMAFQIEITQELVEAEKRNKRDAQIAERDAEIAERDAEIAELEISNIKLKQSLERVAINMLKKSMSAQAIAELIDLSSQEIEDLRKKI